MADRDEEIVAGLRRIYEAFNRGDFDAAIAVVHPEIEVVPVGGQSSLRGAEAVRAWMEPDAFEAQQIEPLEFSIHDNKVLVRQHTRARGAGSGIELEVEIWAVWTLTTTALRRGWRVTSPIRRRRPSKPPGSRSRQCRRSCVDRPLSAGSTPCVSVPSRRLPPKE